MPTHGSPANDEERPLLEGNRVSHPHSDEDDSSDYEIRFSEEDGLNPRLWSPRAKITNVVIIALMAILSPLGSSIFTPGIAQIAKDLNTDEQAVIATTTGYTIMLGIGPLIVAPLSESFGRRPLYIGCFSLFALLQIPTALSPNIEFLIVIRTIAGFFGSVGIANGGGTISDMYRPSERAGVFGWYLLGPLLGPTIGPVFGGLIVTRLGWRWMYGILAIICAANTTIGYFFLRESYAPIILSRKKDAALLDIQSPDPSLADKYHFQGEDRDSLSAKLLKSVKRPLVIFIQPIVFTMALFQGIIFATTYSIYTNLQRIFAEAPYNMNSEQVGLLYLGPGIGSLLAVTLLVPRIDTVFNKLTARNNGKELPEFRLPLANIGSVLIPGSLFWFAWTVETRRPWYVIIASTVFYGVGQVITLNSIQNYYIDSFEKYAASAIAGGSVFRAVVGGVVPLFAPKLFDQYGYGWGVSLFGLAAIIVAPSPLLFYHFGGRLSERYPLKL